MVLLLHQPLHQLQHRPLHTTPTPTPFPTITPCDISELTFHKSVDTITPVQGQNITYTLTIDNSTGSTANNVMVSDILSNNVTFVSATSGGVYNPVTRTINWNVGTIINGAPTITLQYTVTATGSPGSLINNQAVINYNDGTSVCCGSDPVTAIIQPNKNRAIYSVRFNQPFCNPVSGVVFGSKSPIAPHSCLQLLNMQLLVDF